MTSNSHSLLGPPQPPAADANATASSAESRLRAAHAGARVLLAEDHPASQEIAYQLLQAAGLLIDVAADGREALARVAVTAYALVLMDMRMPLMSGEQAARAIRQLPQGATVPIIAMTANAFAEDRVACLAAGMNDFIAKPVQPDVLFELLLRWMAPRRPAVTAAPRAVIPGIDAEPALRLLRGDRARYDKLLRTFVQYHGPDAALLRAAPADGDPEGQEIQRRLHALKGSASAIGAHDLQQQAAALDAQLQQGATALSLAPELGRLAHDLQQLIQHIELGLQG